MLLILWIYINHCCSNVLQIFIITLTLSNSKLLTVRCEWKIDVSRGQIFTWILHHPVIPHSDGMAAKHDDDCYVTKAKMAMVPSFTMIAMVPTFYSWQQWCHHLLWSQWCQYFIYDSSGATLLSMMAMVLNLYLCWQMVPHLYDYNAISLRVTVWNLPISNCLYHFNCENQVITGVLTTPPPRHQRSHYSRHSHDYAFHRCIINDPLQSSSPCYVYHHYILHLQDNDYFVFYNECCSNVIPSFHPPSEIYLWLHFKEHV